VICQLIGFVKDFVSGLKSNRQAIFQHGVTGWLDVMLDQPTGNIIQSDLGQLAREIDRIFLQGSISGHTRWAPAELVPEIRALREYVAQRSGSKD
jgi:tRNA-splicing ligase RtcB (3'-phosphate/5'-hydroxy nucleic acid ligase)